MGARPSWRARRIKHQERTMQPFNSFRKRTNRNLKMPTPGTGGAGLGYADALKEAPSFGDVVFEMGVILVACVGLALAAGVLVKVLGAA
jgi:hypothetical protein